MPLQLSRKQATHLSYAFIQCNERMKQWQWLVSHWKKKKKKKKRLHTLVLDIFCRISSSFGEMLYICNRERDRWMDIHAHTYKSWSLIILFHMFEESFYTRRVEIDYIIPHVWGSFYTHWVEISYWTLYCVLRIFVKGAHFVQGIKVGLNCWE